MFADSVAVRKVRNVWLFDRGNGSDGGCCWHPRLLVARELPDTAMWQATWNHIRDKLRGKWGGLRWREWMELWLYVGDFLWSTVIIGLLKFHEDMSYFCWIYGNCCCIFHKFVKFWGELEVINWGWIIWLFRKVWIFIATQIYCFTYYTKCLIHHTHYKIITFTFA